MLDQEDGTENRYVAFEDYLNVDLQRTIDVAQALDTFLSEHGYRAPIKTYLVSREAYLAKTRTVNVAQFVTSPWRGI